MSGHAQKEDLMQRGSDKHSAWKDDDPELNTRSPVEDRDNYRSAMSSADLPDVDAIDQQMPIDDAEDRDDNLRELPLEVDPADAVEQHSSLGGDAAEDYPWAERIRRP
jgi:hypothetical protein